MKRLKALADPDNLLNPGVIINSSPTANVENLKSIPTIEEEADQCMECGYCEHVCPSRELSLTPRQRILVRREMVRQERRGRCHATPSGARSRLPIPRHQHLRRGRHVPDPVPRRDRHRRAHQALPPPGTLAPRRGRSPRYSETLRYRRAISQNEPAGGPRLCNPASAAGP